MAADTAKSTTVEAVKFVQDAADRYLDESASISRAYFAAWSAATQAGLRTTFQLQNSAIQATRTVADAVVQANLSWFDQTAESIRKSQEATSKVVASGIGIMESALPKAKA